MKEIFQSNICTFGSNVNSTLVVTPSSVRSRKGVMEECKFL